MWEGRKRFFIDAIKYTGKSMHDSHVHLDITEAEWQVFMQDLRDCFAKFKIPAQEQGELVAIVESTKKDIVLKK